MRTAVLDDVGGRGDPKMDGEVCGLCHVRLARHAMCVQAGGTYHEDCFVQSFFKSHGRRPRLRHLSERVLLSAE